MKQNTYMMIYDRFAVKRDQFCAVSNGNKNVSWNYPNIVDWFIRLIVCDIFKKLHTHTTHTPAYKKHTKKTEFYS